MMIKTINVNNQKYQTLWAQSTTWI